MNFKTFYYLMTIIVCISIFTRYTSSQPVFSPVNEDDNPMIESNSILIERVPNLEIRDDFIPKIILIYNGNDEINQPNPPERVRRANFWKRANFWRKRANFWR